MANPPGTGPYAALAQIRDPQLRAALKQILDQVGVLQDQVTGVGAITRPLDGALDASGHLLSQIADPLDDGDAVNLRTLRQYVEGILTGSLKPPPAQPPPTPVLIPGGEPPPPPSPPPSGPLPPGDPGDPGSPTPPPAAPGPPTGPFPPPQPGTGNLRIAGKWFRTPAGGYYRWKSATDFKLLKFYLDGVDITPILADRTGEGATMVRVLGMAINLFDLNPMNYPNYLLQLPTFAGVLAAAGLDFELVVFADAQAISPFDTASEQRDWLQQVRDALVGTPNVVIELVNEGFQNGVSYRDHTRPSGIISAPDSGELPAEGLPLPPWDYATLHTPRDGEWPRKSKNAMEVADYINRPAICDEPMGAHEIDIPGRRSNVPVDFYYYAAVAMLLAGGATFHSEDGLQSAIWQPIQRDCAQNFYTAIDTIPESILSGQYTAGHLGNCPIQHSDALALRTFARFTANAAVCVVVRPTGGWTPIPQGGWSLVSQSGPGGCVVFLSR